MVDLPPTSEKTGSRLPLILTTIALMLGITLAAIESTVVGTAMPTIIGDLGGIQLYGWVFSAYLLTSTTTVPIYGKIADMLGRKPVFLFGVSLFLVGTVLSGVAQSMEQLIVFRAVQGLGAGAVLPITFTVIGDIFSIEQRARMQGLFSGVWGVASVIGPAAGGFITDHLSWRWVFFVNIPFGIAAMVLLAVFFHERAERTRRPIDFVGTITFTLGIAILLLVLLAGGVAWPWQSPQTVLLAIVSIILLGGFIWIESKVPDPMLPLSLFRNRLIAAASVGALTSGAVMFGVTTFVPLFVQGVLNGTAINAGAALAPMNIGWPLASIASARLVLKTGYRTLAIAGGVWLVVGCVLLSLLSPSSSQFIAISGVLLVGVGMGCTTIVFTLGVQSAVTWAQRGVATASGQFFRTIGGSIGVAAMGAVLNAEWLRHLETIQAPGATIDANILLSPSERSQLAPDLLGQLQIAMSGSIHTVFLVILVLAALTLLAVHFIPPGSVHELAHQSDSAAGGTAPVPRRSVATKT